MSTITSASRQPMLPDEQRAGHGQRQAGIVLVRGAETSGRLALVETVERQGSEPPCHCHHWEDETLYVLEGAVMVYRAGTWFHVPTGASTVVPRGTEHTFVVITTTARLLTMFTPAGFEEWYREIGTSTPWNDTLDRVVAAAARFGCEITGPHPRRP